MSPAILNRRLRNAARFYDDASRALQAVLRAEVDFLMVRRDDRVVVELHRGVDYSTPCATFEGATAVEALTKAIGSLVTT